MPDVARSKTSPDSAVKEINALIHKHPSDAFLDFITALLDAHALRAFYDELKQEWGENSARELEVLKRGGIILAITAWETYIENKLNHGFDALIKEATAPSDILSAFNTVAEEWLGSKPKPPDLAQWTSTGWKDLVSTRFRRELDGLNTPNSINIRKLTKRYLGIDVTRYWKWRGVSSERACQSLDSLIRFRGELVHRGRSIEDNRALVSRHQLINALALILRLGDCTENAMG